jgi:hypothetical protein
LGKIKFMFQTTKLHNVYRSFARCCWHWYLYFDSYVGLSEKKGIPRSYPKEWLPIFQVENHQYPCQKSQLCCIRIFRHTHISYDITFLVKHITYDIPLYPNIFHFIPNVKNPKINPPQ